MHQHDRHVGVGLVHSLVSKALIRTPGTNQSNIDGTVVPLSALLGSLEADEMILEEDGYTHLNIINAATDRELVFTLTKISGERHSETERSVVIELMVPQDPLMVVMKHMDQEEGVPKEITTSMEFEFFAPPSHQKQLTLTIRYNTNTMALTLTISNLHLKIFRYVQLGWTYNMWVTLFSLPNVLVTLTRTGLTANEILDIKFDRFGMIFAYDNNDLKPMILSTPNGPQQAHININRATGICVIESSENILGRYNVNLGLGVSKWKAFGVRKIILTKESSGHLKFQMFGLTNTLLPHISLGGLTLGKRPGATKTLKNIAATINAPDMCHPVAALYQAANINDEEKVLEKTLEPLLQGLGFMFNLARLDPTTAASIGNIPFLVAPAIPEETKLTVDLSNAKLHLSPNFHRGTGEVPGTDNPTLNILLVRPHLLEDSRDPVRDSDDDEEEVVLGFPAGTSATMWAQVVPSGTLKGRLQIPESTTITVTLASDTQPPPTRITTYRVTSDTTPSVPRDLKFTYLPLQSKVTVDLKIVPESGQVVVEQTTGSVVQKGKLQDILLTASVNFGEALLKVNGELKLPTEFDLIHREFTSPSGTLTQYTGGKFALLGSKVTLQEPHLKLPEVFAIGGMVLTMQPAITVSGIIDYKSQELDHPVITLPPAIALWLQSATRNKLSEYRILNAAGNAPKTITLTGDSNSLTPSDQEGFVVLEAGYVDLVPTFREIRFVPSAMNPSIGPDIDEFAAQWLRVEYDRSGTSIVAKMHIPRSLEIIDYSEVPHLDSETFLDPATARPRTHAKTTVNSFTMPATQRYGIMVFGMYLIQTATFKADVRTNAEPGLINEFEAHFTVAAYRCYLVLRRFMLTVERQADLFQIVIPPGAYLQIDYLQWVPLLVTSTDKYLRVVTLELTASTDTITRSGLKFVAHKTGQLELFFDGTLCLGNSAASTKVDLPQYTTLPSATSDCSELQHRMLSTDPLRPGPIIKLVDSFTTGWLVRPYATKKGWLSPGSDNLVPMVCAVMKMLASYGYGAPTRP